MAASPDPPASHSRQQGAASSFGAKSLSSVSTGSSDSGMAARNYIPSAPRKQWHATHIQHRPPRVYTYAYIIHVHVPASRNLNLLQKKLPIIQPFDGYKDISSYLPTDSVSPVRLNRNNCSSVLYTSLWRRWPRLFTPRNSIRPGQQYTLPGPLSPTTLINAQPHNPWKGWALGMGALGDGIPQRPTISDWT